MHPVHATTSLGKTRVPTPTLLLAAVLVGVTALGLVPSANGVRVLVAGSEALVAVLTRPP